MVEGLVSIASMDCHKDAQIRRLFRYLASMAPSTPTQSHAWISLAPFRAEDLRE